jgi:hypothetical protein
MGEAGTIPRAKGKQPRAPRTLSAGDELSVFNIHNMFWHHWFLSQDHLVANAISAQKAKDRKIFWVEFAPQFHTHLVKCAVALVPRPLHKVKKVMFGYILELLNGEGPQAFFNLTMGQRQATQAQKEKRWLVQKRNRASRCDHQAATKVAANGPKHYCKYCKRQFASHWSQKRHRCPYSKEISEEGGIDKGKGLAQPQPKKNKPIPKTPCAAPNNLTPSTTPPPSSSEEASPEAYEKEEDNINRSKPKTANAKTAPFGCLRSGLTPHYHPHDRWRARLRPALREDRRTLLGPAQHPAKMQDSTWVNGHITQLDLRSGAGKSMTRYTAE